PRQRCRPPRRPWDRLGRPGPARRLRGPAREPGGAPPKRHRCPPQLRGHRLHAVTDRREGDHGGERVRVRSAQLSDPSVTVTFWNRSRYSSSVSTSSPGLCTSSPAWKPPSRPHGFCSTTQPSSLTPVTT